MTQENNTTADELRVPVQMEWNLDFKRQYSDIALKEAVRGVKAITKECIRFGLTEDAVTDIIQTLGIGKPIVLAAVEAIDDKIAD
jgi:hypothetical protein